MAIRIPSAATVRLPINSSSRVRTSFPNVFAVGGDVVSNLTINNITYRVHTFTSSGILTVTSAENGVAPVEYLCVAGGGGGGTAGSTGSNYVIAGGGGAGGLLQGIVNLNATTYIVTIGTGGASGSSGTPSYIGISTVGPYVVSCTGGGGPAPSTYPGSVGVSRSGGSGGGGGYINVGNPGTSAGAAGIPGQGNPGAPGGAGGGGGGAGSAASTNNGGAGVQSFITGYPQWLAGGGAGGGGIGGSGVGGSSPMFGLNALSYGSGGGGGLMSNPNSTSPGGSGFQGLVIIRYRIS